MDVGYIISEYVTFIYILGVYNFLGMSPVSFTGMSRTSIHVSAKGLSFSDISPCKSISVLCTSPRNISVLEKVYGYNILDICTNEKIGRRHQHVLYKPKTQKNN